MGTDFDLFGFLNSYEALILLFLLIIGIFIFSLLIIHLFGGGSEF